ncbi:hypothetical protein J19TS2_18550 [Cohnella xylanilytica]|uniref:FkbM family methyltransferase n=1 Tax=Cohnella xylanilytica TaxID=557555 RepID=UPI001B008880|nr:FkbM family methyltransferase [Cohnella xylanilytica]GIO12300.1 hypothetical protein J19TS2_18550 [Cohnella xylanilytica]
MNSVHDFRGQLLREDLYDISTKNYVDQVKDKKPVVIWGSCSTGQLVYELFEKFGISENIEYFADNSPNKWGTEQNGLPVLNPDEVVRLAKNNPDVYIIISALHQSDIYRQLRSLGIEDHNIDVQGFGLARGYWTYRQETPYRIIEAHLEDYEKVYSLLEDERSKSVYLGILNYKISLDNQYMADISSPPEEQYFEHDIIRIKSNEVFCDCGSFNGDTLESFMNHSGGAYRKYIAIEADQYIFKELNDKVSSNGYESVQTYNVACWNEKTILKFESDQSSGHITDSGSISVAADTLDNLLKDEEITFLKMDIEGAEERALIGANEIIQKYKPTLAICLYHSLEDYYKLPLLIKKLNPDYRLFVRHYKDRVDVETVCYAIPKQ